MIEHIVLLPDFELLDGLGNVVKRWDYKQRRNLVVFFHHGLSCIQCCTLCSKFGTCYHEFRNLSAEILAIGPDSVTNIKASQSMSGLPFPLLSDPLSQTLTAFRAVSRSDSESACSVFVADRYGVIHYQAQVDGHGAFPPCQELLDWLQFIEMQCPG